jgi:hypothetical protein
VETVAFLPRKGEEVDIVCSAWKHAAVALFRVHGQKLTTFGEHKGELGNLHQILRKHLLKVYLIIQ